MKDGGKITLGIFMMLALYVFCVKVASADTIPIGTCFTDNISNSTYCGGTADLAISEILGVGNPNFFYNNSTTNVSVRIQGNFTIVQNITYNITNVTNITVINNVTAFYKYNQTIIMGYNQTLNESDSNLTVISPDYPIQSFNLTGGQSLVNSTLIAYCSNVQANSNTTLGFGQSVTDSIDNATWNGPAFPALNIQQYLQPGTWASGISGNYNASFYCNISEPQTITVPSECTNTTVVQNATCDVSQVYSTLMNNTLSISSQCTDTEKINNDFIGCFNRVTFAANAACNATQIAYTQLYAVQMQNATDLTACLAREATNNSATDGLTNLLAGVALLICVVYLMYEFARKRKTEDEG